MGPNFSLGEALQLLGLCAYAETGAPEPPIPDPRTGWNLLFDSPVMGPFQNKWQLWQKMGNGPFAIALRGTVGSARSILEDVVALMVKAAGTLTVGGAQCGYSFAADKEAGVHFGFALGTLLLLNDPTSGILKKLNELVPAGSEVYITGHSQGAAMATLLRSYLHYNAGAPKNLSFKTYVFAQPKPGNDHYAEDFETQFCGPAMAFRINNTLDWVTEVPFTLQFVQDIDTPNPLTVLASPSFLMTLIAKGLSELRSLIEDHTRSHFQPLAVAVAQTRPLPPAAAGGTALQAVPYVAEFMDTLNYVGAGEEHPLKGNPCAGAECQDFLFEHHATTYFGLLSALVA